MRRFLTALVVLAACHHRQLDLDPGEPAPVPNDPPNEMPSNPTADPRRVDQGGTTPQRPAPADIHLVPTIENGNTVMLTDRPLFCWTRDGADLCYLNNTRCVTEADQLRATSPCREVHAVACFLMTDVMSGHRDPWCFSSMSVCHEAQNHYVLSDDVSGITQCFVVRRVR